MEQPPQFPETEKDIFAEESEETRRLRKELEHEHIVFRLLSPDRDTIDVVDDGKLIKVAIIAPDYPTLGIFWKNEAGEWEEISRGEPTGNINDLVRDIHANWPRVSKEMIEEREANKPEDVMQSPGGTSEF